MMGAINVSLSITRHVFFTCYWCNSPSMVCVYDSKYGNIVCNVLQTSTPGTMFQKL